MHFLIFKLVAIVFDVSWLNSIKLLIVWAWNVSSIVLMNCIYFYDFTSKELILHIGLVGGWFYLKVVCPNLKISISKLVFSQNQNYNLFTLNKAEYILFQMHSLIPCHSHLKVNIFVQHTFTHKIYDVSSSSCQKFKLFHLL